MYSKSMCLWLGPRRTQCPSEAPATDAEPQGHSGRGNSKMGLPYGQFPILYPSHALGDRETKGNVPSPLHWDGSTSDSGWCPAPPLPHQELVKLDWNIFAQPLEETISKLESAEPDILLHKELMAQLLPTPVTSKSSSLSNKRKATAQAGGTASKKQKKPQCPICGKFHHGQCRFAKTTTKSKDTSFKGKTKHFKSEFLKLMK